MAKNNSLKEVPYGKKARWNTNEDGARYIDKVDALLEYTYGTPENPSEGVTYIPNDPFKAELRIVELERGRSAARFWFENTATGTLYPMFGQGIVELIKSVTLDHGVMSGTWIAVKRGANYGIERYEA